MKMRLIDADALIHTHESEVATIGNDWTIGDLAAAIETAPTIDAIPMEWLKVHADNIAVKGTLAIWQKEQEDDE